MTWEKKISRSRNEGRKIKKRGFRIQDLGKIERNRNERRELKERGARIQVQKSAKTSIEKRGEEKEVGKMERRKLESIAVRIMHTVESHVAW